MRANTKAAKQSVSFADLINAGKSPEQVKQTTGQRVVGWFSVKSAELSAAASVGFDGFSAEYDAEKATLAQIQNAQRMQRNKTRVERINKALTTAGIDAEVTI